MGSCDAIVVFSGGQDSTTCLFWAFEKFGRDKVRTISFDYGQRHSREIQSAKAICQRTGIDFDLITIPQILRSSSSLVNNETKLETHNFINEFKPGLQETFVPGRNILFLVIAANIALHYNAKHLVAGLCQEDYGGYYDCRNDFVKAMRAALNQGLFAKDTGLEIHTPLMFLSKAESVKLAQRLGSECMEALALSHTCYNGQYPPCGQCHACLIRARGFQEAGIQDPLCKNC